MNRRQMLASGFAAASFAGLSELHPAFAQTGEEADDILASVLAERKSLEGQTLERLAEVEYIAKDRSVVRQFAVSADLAVPPLTADEIQRLRSRKYWNVAPADRLSIDWPSAAHAPDYEHLAAFGAPAPGFSIDANVLTRLATRNAFTLRTLRPVTLFGLRGCRIASGAGQTEWAQTHALEIGYPDHVNSKCVIGVWRRSDKALRLFQGSTVPAAAAMYMSLADQGAGTSIVPTGLYRFRLGEHWASEPTRIQRGALINAGSYVVLRTAKHMSYDPGSDTTAWTRGSVHNIHAGGAATRFSCAGCQVLPGKYSGADRKTSSGVWRTFQESAGLVDAAGEFVQPEATSSYDYMLLTGQEAALASLNSPAFQNGYLRLRPGSEGAEVKYLQEDLLKRHKDTVRGLSVSGRFDISTSFAVLLQKKLDVGQYKSPVVLL